MTKLCDNLVCVGVVYKCGIHKNGCPTSNLSSHPIGNGIFYCKVCSIRDKIFYQQVSEECIHHIGMCMLQSLALCLVPLFFLACGFSVALSKKQVLLHVLIQLNGPQWGNSVAASSSF